MEIQFGVQFQERSDKQLSSERIINAYAERQPRTAKSPVTVFGAPGIEEWATAGVGPYRGGIVIAGVPYVVSGSQLFRITSAGVAQLCGVGITGISRVGIDSSLTEVVVVNGVNGFSYLIATDNFAQINDADFNAAATVTNINNIFAFDELGSNHFQISNVLDGRTYDDEFGTGESNPDKVLAVKNKNGTLQVLGETTTEFWDHTGASDFPFTRFKSGTIDRGLRAVHAVVNEDQSTFILGNDLIAYRISGTGLQRISTFALEEKWNTYSTTSDAFMFSVPIGGHKFIYLTFPTMNRTFGYDIASGLWHERMSWDATGLEVKWRVGGCLPAYDKILVGDLNSGRIGILNPDVHTEFGDPIVTTLVSPPIHGNGKRLFVPRLEVDMQVGKGLTTGQGTDPQIMMSYSWDGGETYSAPQEFRAFGKIGEYQTRVQWHQLGSGYSLVIKLSISDPVRRTIIGARLPDSYLGT